jgi:hypothetical protein
MRILELPHPSSLNVVEADTKSVNLRVLVVGEDADDFLQTIHDALSKKLPEDERTLDLTLSNEPSITYVPIRLGDLRGWKTRVHFYGFRSDPRLVDHLMDYCEDVDGVLLAQAGKSLDAVSKKLATRLKKARKNYPTVIFGKSDIAKQWTKESGLDVFKSVPSEEMTAVKALASEMLARLKPTS